MAKAPDFANKTIYLLGFRSSLICNNPKCATVTVGAMDWGQNKGPLTIKIGEAAHICAARDGEARYDASMSDAQRADFSNGLWLCASCHTMIDKNKTGTAFPAPMLRKWKADHEAMISGLLLSHRSPLRFLRGFTEDQNVARRLVDLLEQQGAMFMEMIYEKGQHVDLSIAMLRDETKQAIKEVEYDDELKMHLKKLGQAFQKYMNFTSNFPGFSPDELRTLRNTVGIFLAIMEKDYWIHVKGEIRTIMPK